MLLAAVAAVNAAADGADDSEITPSQIAAQIRLAAKAPEIASAPAGAPVHRILDDALDAVADGMPSDHVAALLYAALAAIGESAEGLEGA